MGSSQRRPCFAASMRETRMDREHSSPRRKGVLIATGAALVGALLVATSPAVAEQPAKATVVQVRQDVGRTATGIRIDEISATRRVGYADLDLATQSGVATLKGRIADAARQICSQLDTLYPANSNLLEPPAQDCVKSAINTGIAQAKVAIAGAGGEYSLR